MERLNLTYEVMKEINPAIIYARLKGFGLSGPWQDFKCYDMVAQAAAGAFSVTGEADGPPMMPGSTVGDSGTGTELALAITAAYVQRQRTGEGQFIEITMQEAMTYFMRTRIAYSQWGERVAPRNGNAAGAPTNLYPCKSTPGSEERGGNNEWVYIMVVTSRMWDTLCATIDRPELLLDPRFEDMWKRNENGQELYEEISQVDQNADQVGGHGRARRGGRALLGGARHLRPVPQPALRGARLRPRPRSPGARQDPPARLGAEDVQERRPD